MTQYSSVPLIVAWDALAVLLVLFPLFSGGVWTQRPGLFIELSDLGIPVLVVGALAAVIQASGRPLLERSRVLGLLGLAWRRWQEALERRPWVTLSVASAFFAALVAWAALRRHEALGSHSNDLGIYLNGLWNFVEGRGYVSGPAGGMNLLGDHQSPSYLALAPLLRLFPGAGVILIAQAVALALGGMALYFFAKPYFAAGESPWAPAALPLLYWMYQPLRNVGLSDFHPDALMLPAFFAGLAGLQSASWRKRAAGVAALIFALGVKEAAPAALAGVGLAWAPGTGAQATRAWTRRAGAALFAAGVAAFALDLAVVPRWFGVTRYNHAYEYGEFGPRLTDLFLAPLLQPGKFLSHLAGPIRLRYLFWTLAPLGFLPLLNPIGLIAALPGYLMLFLAGAEYRISIAFHYAVVPAVGLFFAMPGALRRAAAWRPGRWLALWLLFWALGANGRSTWFWIRGETPDAHGTWIVQELLPAVDPAISISAPDALVPHLSLRPTVILFPHLTDSAGAPVDCVLEDFGVRNLDLEAPAIASYREQLRTLGYRAELRCQGLVAYSRGRSCFTRVPACR